jgi:hypothetical protein
VGIGFGGRVFCCDNLSLVADHVIRRKHTPNAKHELPGLIMEMVEPIADQRDTQQKTFALYRRTPLTQMDVDHAIMDLYRSDVLNVQRIADVEREWRKPTFEEFKEENAWRRFNAVTFVLNGRIVAEPRNSEVLHRVI